MLKRLKNSRGFTLVELLVVMAIIAIIVTLIIYAINAARMQSRNTQRRNIANTAKAALEAYYSTYKRYPATPASSTITALLSADAPAGVQNYATGITAESRDDPLAQNTRLCYIRNTNNTYWMGVLAEPPSTNPGPCPVGPYTAPWEDFSVR